MRKGFSLIELSIGLVIIGLIVGGIMAGQSLIRAAEVRSVMTDFDKYKSASLQFRQKYDALPGDFANAEATWGTAHATDATCVTTASTTPLTCNGDENGQITTAVRSNERFRYWQHLANAGFIEGQYIGIQQGTTANGATTANVPSGRLKTSLWHVNWFGNLSGSTIWFDGSYDNGFQYGGQTLNFDPAQPIFKPEEAWNIDTKIDDGKPATGKLVVRAQGGFNTCTTAAAGASTNLAADYLLSGTTLTCSLTFRNHLLKN
ncbi:MAG: prepilin-type N-terminal cleavage/methylation domain-containing protein [Alphaproteobacteria bacterium]|nr:prepilin-type N-terminal cleavage/methylation domain-containing protein [Alphaproteobacteria bacterium]